jgi:Na+:H+ antiporter, NhaA family
MANSTTSTPIDQLLRPLRSLASHSSTTGILLFVMAVIAMIWANSPWSHSYHALWETHFAIKIGDFGLDKPLHHWINDGLMAIFFFVVGLEIKREILAGELSSWKKSILPIGAALGGMLVPALLYEVFNSSTRAAGGWGIPMATDIAFSLGLLSLVSKRVPLSVKIFLTALAIVDDLGAVLVIAFFYTSNISVENLMIGGAFMLVLLGGNRMGVRSTTFYAIVGIGGLWLAFLLSGIHATIAGVLAALAIPGRTKLNEYQFMAKMRGLMNRFEASEPNGNPFLTSEQLHLIEKMKVANLQAETPLQKLEHVMHPLISFVIMPLFALANAGVTIEGEVLDLLISPVSLGVMVGLVVGKFIGVAGTSWLLVRLGLAQLPKGAGWNHIIGVALLAGIGFTMSLFITELALEAPLDRLEAKLGILVASVIAGALGLFYLSRQPELHQEAEQNEH